MILIEDDILDLIAGGIPTVTIIGHPEPDPWFPPGDWGDWGGGGGDDGSGGGGGGGGSGGGDPPPPPPPPCVHTSAAPAGGGPANVNINELRDLMASLGRTIVGSPGSSTFEYGVIVVADATGHLRAGPLVQGTPGSINMSIDAFPGEKVVGYLHSHPILPSNPNLDQRFPSSPGSVPAHEAHLSDTAQATSLVAQSIADPNMLMDILDMKSGKVYEYKANQGLNQPATVGHNITDDTNGCQR